MNLFFRILCAALIVQSVGAMAADRPADRPAEKPLETVISLDLPRYLGRWYEIAKFPNWFQKKCVANTSAQYSLQPDGRVRVLNRCQREGGVMDGALGVARQLGGPTSPRLEVRFAPAWLSWLPAVWGDYWVVDLDPEYQLVAVSEPRRDYLWILSRSPTVPAERYASLITRLQAKGLDTSRLELTPQDETKH